VLFYWCTWMLVRTARMSREPEAGDRKRGWEEEQRRLKELARKYEEELVAKTEAFDARVIPYMGARSAVPWRVPG